MNRYSRIIGKDGCVGIQLFLMIFTVAFLSSLSQAVTGFGSAIVMMALLPLFIPSDVSVMLSLIFGGLMSAWLLWKCREGIRWRYILTPGIFSSLGAILGLFVGSQAPPSLYMRLLGILLFALSIWFLLLAKHVHIKATFMAGAISGTVSGVLGAMFSIAGPPLVLYYSAATENKAIYMSALQACLVFLSIIAIAGRFAMGLWPLDMGTYLLPCSAGVISGLLPGLWIYNKMDVAQLKKIIYLFMCAAGIYIAINA